MLIEKITQKYRKKSSDESIIRNLKDGKQEFFYYYEPGISVKLNQAIDWRFSKVPDGEKKELEEGDTFMFDGRPQIISLIDDDILKLITSDTGPLALERIVREIINPELKMAFADISDITATWEIVPELARDIIAQNQDLGYEVIPYEKYKIIKEKLLPGREDILDPKNFMIEVKISGGNIPFPSEFFLNKSGIFYDKDFYEEEDMGYIINDILSWLYKNIEVLGRHEFETEKAEREAKEQQEALEKLLTSAQPQYLNQGMQNQGCSGNCKTCSNPCTNPNKNLKP
jgi:hypothetical protein